MENYKQYQNYKKPKWAPPSWLFAPVWTVLYCGILISYGYVGYLFFNQVISFKELLPFILNLVFNLLYTPIQFGLRSFKLALLDILLVLGTLIWALVIIYPHEPKVVWVNLPYLIWVTFATVLQCTVTYLNRKR